MAYGLSLQEPAWFFRVLVIAGVVAIWLGLQPFQAAALGASLEIFFAVVVFRSRGRAKSLP